VGQLLALEEPVERGKHAADASLALPGCPLG